MQRRRSWIADIKWFKWQIHCYCIYETTHEYSAVKQPNENEENKHAFGLLYIYFLQA